MKKVSVCILATIVVVGLMCLSGCSDIPKGEKPAPDQSPENAPGGK